MKSIIVIFLSFLIYFGTAKSNSCLAQEFEVDSLITIPGNNYNFDICYYYPYILFSWINELDSVYTVYYKQIGLTGFHENVIVSKSHEVKSNVQISYSGVAWQVNNQNGWQICYRPFTNKDSLGDIICISDTIHNDPQITMNNNRIAWIDDGRLLVKELFNDTTEITTVDSLNCYNPNLDKFDYDYRHGSSIIYEKSIPQEKSIFYADLNNDFSPIWNLSFLTSSKDIYKPRFCIGGRGSITFQFKEDNFWQVQYSYLCLEEKNLDTLKNDFFNMENPDVFIYAIPAGSVKYGLPFFVIFNNDSIPNDKEVFIYTFGYDTENSFINISNAKGNDYQPRVTYISDSTGTYVTIIWIHEENSKQDIWFAKTKFVPIWSDIKEEELVNSNSYFLAQNYPNPFNPTTKIKYSIPFVEVGHAPSLHITLKVYDILGSEVAILVNEEKPAGNYETMFEGTYFSSGIYFYQLKAGNFVETKKFILMK